MKGESNDKGCWEKRSKGWEKRSKGRGKREGKGEGGWGGVGVKGRKFKLTEKEKKCITNEVLHCYR